MAALADAYPTGECGCGRGAAAEEIVMMLPDRRSFIPGRKLLMVRRVAVRFPSSGPGLLKLPPPLATRHCALCAEIRKACEESCEEFAGDATMKACEDACRRCFESCRRMGQDASAAAESATGLHA